MNGTLSSFSSRHSTQRGWSRTVRNTCEMIADDGVLLNFDAFGIYTSIASSTLTMEARAG